MSSKLSLILALLFGVILVASSLPAHQSIAQTVAPVDGDAAPIYQSWPGPGVYVFFDYTNMDPAQYPFITGGHEVATWSTVEKRQGQFDWGWLDKWIADNAALGKPVGLGFNTYDGQCCSQPDGHWLPQWFMAQNPDGFITCDGIILPKYWSESYLTAFGDWIAAAAARYDNDPRVAWIEISSGIYGETKPAENEFNACLQENGLTSELWIETVNRITDLYLSLWHHKPLLIQYAPWYLKREERRAFTDYAGARGVGMKHNKLLVDHDDQIIDAPDYFLYRAGQYDPFFTFAGQGPTSWEAYRMFFDGPSDTLWGFLNGLNKHPTYILVTRSLLITTDPFEQEVLTFANRYAGRTVEDTPSVWIALRETLNDWYPQRGNFDFWLYQNDTVPGGKTVPVWNVDATPQGRYTRRTDQSTGNPSMFFDVDDAYLFQATAPVTVTVTYRDYGTDAWELHYDSYASNTKLAGRVQKRNTRAWLKTTFVLPDAQMANGMAMPGSDQGSDFRIWSADDGDEFIHFVDVQKTGSGQGAAPIPTPTPQPTPSPTPPSLHALHAGQPLTIDGDLADWPAGETWLLDNTLAAYVNSRSNPDPADASARLQVAWDATGLYFSAVITDSQHIADSTDIWRDDSIELGFDGANDHRSGGADDHQYTAAVDGRLTDWGVDAVTGAAIATQSGTDHYTVEAFIPLAALGLGSLSSYQTVGLNLGLHDDDDGGDWDSYMVLFGNSTQDSAPTWGDVSLLPPTSNRVGGRTWYDVNANGSPDPNEHDPLSNVSIAVLNNDDQILAFTDSTESGEWSIDGLAPGVYTLKAEQPAGAVATTPLELTITLPADNTVNFGFLGTTAVVVQRVDLEAQPQAVTLRWQTTFEVDNTGFIIQRREGDAGPIKPLTRTPLPSQATPTAGASYRFVDDNVSPGRAYTYWIESVPGGTVLGPLSVIVPLPAGRRSHFMPLIQR